MKILRTYQKDCLNEVYDSFRNDDKSLVSMATGAGKTILFCALIEKCIAIKKDIKILVLVNRVKLVEQNRNAAVDFGINKTSIYCASLKQRDINQVTFSTIQSIKNNPDFFHLIILDEAHTLSRGLEDYYDECKKINPKLKFLGVTATPFSKEGFIYGKNKFFPKVNYSLSLDDLIKMGHLCDYILRDSQSKFETRGLKKQKGDYNLKELSRLVDDVPKAQLQVNDIIERTKERKKIAIICVDIHHCEKIHRLVNEFEPCAITHSNMNRKSQNENMQKFETTDCRFIVSVGQLTEGYDYPAIDCVALLRPTRSARLAVQAIGRGLRLFPGKKDCLVLDYGDVLIHCGTPRDPIIDDLTVKKKTIFADFKPCPECLTYIPKNDRQCFGCGFKFVYKISDREKNLNTKPLYSLEDVDSSRCFVNFMRVDFNYIGKSGKKSTKISYHTNRGLKMKWLFRESEIKHFKLVSHNGNRKPVSIKLTDNPKNKTYPIITEEWE